MAIFVLVWGSVVYVAGKEADKSQPTLMTVCWTPAYGANVAVYQDEILTPTCDAPEELVWAKKTKKVYWAMPPEYDVHREGYRLALKYWNSNLNYTVFVVVDTAEEADVVIQPRPDSGKTATSHSRTLDGAISSVINIRSGLTDIRRFMLDLQHELGHALGLAHDLGSSIMNKNLEEGDTLIVWLVTEKDKKRLKEIMDL
jgi:predicted Zn-dependent protease